MDREAYLNRPWWVKWLDVIFFVSGYLLVAVAGVMAVVLINEWPAREGGYALIGAGILATVGVFTRLYNFELIALWPIVTGLGACIIWLVLNDAQLTGWLVGALIPHFSRRLLVLTRLARRARRLHELGVEHGVV